MKVTFRAEGKVLGFYPGKIYTEELTPLIEVLLRKGEHLSLIDPPSLDLPEPKVEEKPVGNSKSKSYEAANPAAGDPSGSGQSYGDGASKKSGERSTGSEKARSN